MATKLHHRSKRYEIQKYNVVSLAWNPIDHTDDATLAMRKLTKIIKTGEHARILDRVALAVVEANRPTTI